ncbi:MAG: TatD family hydrolase [Steroidobacteraceae bacterium]
MSEWVDIGLNLAHDSYDADRAAVMQRAQTVGVVQCIVTGASLEGTRRAIELAREDSGRLRATAGFHPHHACDLDGPSLEALSSLATDPLVAAVGECGLDYHRNFSSPREQREAFSRQLQLAVALQKPLFLHARDAHHDFMALLHEHRHELPPAVLHCFTGNREELEACLDFGLFIGITGWICDERRGLHLRDLVSLIPAGRLMVETDAPYLLPRDLDPKPASRRNEPSYLPHVGRVVAQLRGESTETLAAHTTDTARRFFRFPFSGSPHA